VADLPYMRFWVGDYLGATSHLSAEEHGAYLLLLMAAWRSDGGLPSDEQRLARIARVDGQRWGAVWEAIGGFFVADGEHFRNRRLSEELTSAKADKDSAVAKAKAAAEKRWGTQKGAPSHAPSIASSNAPRMLQAMLGGMLEQCQSESESESELKLKILSDSRTDVRGQSSDKTKHFDAFWAAYPRKDKKLDARPAWKKAALTVGGEPQLLALILAALEWQRKLRQWGDRSMIPQPPAYLNGARWTDEPSATAQSSFRPADPYRKVL